MNLRFLADADLNPAIGRGLRRREPAISFQAAEGVIPDGMPDPEVLRMAADLNRVLVSRGLATMPAHFARFIEDHESPGLLMVQSRRSIGSVIDGLLLVWTTWAQEDIRNRALWLP